MRHVDDLRPTPAPQLLFVCATTRATIPLMSATAACGFPSPAEDYLDRPLDFNQLLIENAPATFAARVSGESMTGAGIFPGDIAVVNRARRVVDKAIVLALVDGEFTLKRYRRRGSRVWLQAENPTFKDIDILDGMAFEVWGVVTHSIRTL
ncbi:translesion error-prone DNA polymerase V autoproteolytic subunit [soil metagenome]